MSDLPSLTLPLSVGDARNLAVGDMVILDGIVTGTAGYVTHERLIDALDARQMPPVDLRGGAFFHLGSNCREDGDRWLPNYVNPTTSTRFDAFMPRLIRELGLTSTGGKGGMGPGCVEALREAGCVYFAMPGGASPLLSQGVVERLATGWDDLIEQFRLSTFRIADFGPVTVGIDAHGNSMYADLKQAAENRLPGILRDLAASRQGHDQA